MAANIEESPALQSVAQIAQMPHARQATATSTTPTFKANGGGLLAKIFNAFKFAASAIVGIPAAVSATAFIGSLYLLAEATDIVETNVKSNFKGDKKVYHNPFFQKISENLGYALGKTWSEFGAYAPLTTLRATSNFIQDHTKSPALRVSALVEELARSNPPFKEALRDLPNIAQNADFYKNATRHDFPDVAQAIDSYQESSIQPSVSPQYPHGVGVERISQPSRHQ